MLAYLLAAVWCVIVQCIGAILLLLDLLQLPFSPAEQPRVSSLQIISTMPHARSFLLEPCLWKHVLSSLNINLAWAGVRILQLMSFMAIPDLLLKVLCDGLWEHLQALSEGAHCLPGGLWGQPGIPGRWWIVLLLLHELEHTRNDASALLL